MSGAGRELAWGGRQGVCSSGCVPAVRLTSESISSYTAGLNVPKGLSKTRSGAGESCPTEWPVALSWLGTPEQD